MKTRYVVAVSGGVDSVVLLHQLIQRPELDVIVAHFDHGIRDDSHHDATFVQKLADTYGLLFESKREALGAQASEELARERRYEFLRAVTKKHGAQLVTAHHADDAVETVAINFTRGTGWRGLAVLDSDVVRPLIDISKQEIIAYAQKHNLSWHEDSTNASDVYLRNRLRLKTGQLSNDVKRQILGLRMQQIHTKKQIEYEVHQAVGDGPIYSRYFFTHADTKTAIECLRYCAFARLTRPQLERALLAVKANKSGSTFEAGSGVRFRFTSRNFDVELIK